MENEKKVINYHKAKMEYYKRVQKEANNKEDNDNKKLKTALFKEKNR